MNRKKITIAAGVMFGLLILPSVGSQAFAQYVPGPGSTGLDDYLILSEKRVQMIQDKGAEGAGVPIFAADGVLGTVALSTGIFGGIAVAFFVLGRKGKYAEIGRG